MNRGIYATAFDEDVPTDDQTHDQQTCPECSGRVTTTSHETVCEACGLVVDEDRIDPGPEWRSFETDTDHNSPERTGAPLTPARHDRGLSTKIGRQTDANGTQLSQRKRWQLNRLRREQGRALRGSTRERNQVYGLTDIRRLASALGLGTELRDRACRLFQSAQAADLFRGRSIEAMSAAAVYAACRCDGRPETLADMGPLARVPKPKVKNAYTVLNRELSLPVPPRSPEQFLPRIVSALDVSERVEREARAMLAEAEPTLASGGAHPGGIAGGAVLVAAETVGERSGFTQTELADIVDVAVPTLRTRRNELTQMYRE